MSLEAVTPFLHDAIVRQMGDMVDRPDNAITELTWTADGAEYELVRFADLPTTSADWVEFLGQLMGCDAATAEEAYRILFEEDESFADAVRRDIAALPVSETLEA